jgi:nitrate/TMAO reductase-like tetraheme cytochrome c subunit
MFNSGETGRPRKKQKPPMSNKIILFLLITAVALLTRASFPGDVTVVYAIDSSQDYQEPIFCANCHEAEFAEWNETAHAQAFSDPVFQEQWQAEGSPDVCLQCHTTGFDRTTGDFEFEGVTCEMCHGLGGTMNLNTTAEFCSSCHSYSHFPTYREWLESEHSHSDVECVDCHDLPSLELKAESPTALCGQCHAETLEESLQGTHGIEGFVCTDCHIVKRQPDFTNGEAAVTGHTFMPGVPDPDCESCHEVILEAHDVWGADSENCITCHDPMYMTILHLLNGTDLAMSESSILCEQCHSEDYYELEMGIHAGPHEEDASCIDCHSPMNPYMIGNHTLPPLPERSKPTIGTGLPIPPIYLIGTIAVVGSVTVLTYLGTRRSR